MKIPNINSFFVIIIMKKKGLNYSALTPTGCYCTGQGENPVIKNRDYLFKALSGRQYGLPFGCRAKFFFQICIVIMSPRWG